MVVKASWCGCGAGSICTGTSPLRFTHIARLRQGPRTSPWRPLVNRNPHLQTRQRIPSRPFSATHRHNEAQRQKPSHASTPLVDETLVNEFYDAVVVGAGPAGIAVVGNLLERHWHDSRKSRILWVDDAFSAGRLHKYYREVPSNTKIKYFLKYAEELEVFRWIFAKRDEPTAYTDLKAMDPESTCVIEKAARMCRLLTDGLNEELGVVRKHGQVKSAQYIDPGWSLHLDLSKTEDGEKSIVHGHKLTNEPPFTKVFAPLLVLAQGAHPLLTPLPVALPVLPLDECLLPSLLPHHLPKQPPPTAVNQKVTIAVIGASHSAILVLLNLSSVALTTHPYLRIKWFTRHPLRYAEERPNGWIYRDNTGLKGTVADWARKNLDGDALTNPNSAHSTEDLAKVITKVDTSGGPEREWDVMRRELEGCQYVVQAVGYGMNEPPTLHINMAGKDAKRAYTSSQTPVVENKSVDQHTATSPSSTRRGGLRLAHDPHTGAIRDADTGRTLPGLYGAGIAWPEEVTDPEGNVEKAVGLWKFMRYLRAVVPSWR